MLSLCQLRGLHRFLCNAAGAAALAWLPLAGSGALAQEIEALALEDVRKGQRGYGLSVFSGSEIERFEVEILGVWNNMQPGTSYVLARLSGQGLEESGVIAGMSGSPVYIDGKLLGAVSFGWPFTHEAVGGITPVEHMRPMLEVEAPAAAPVAISDEFSLGRLLEGEFSEADLRESLSMLEAPRIGEAPTAIEWAAVGFGESVRSLLGQEMGTVAAAGSQGALATAGGESESVLEPGSAVAAVLVDGDLRLAATGTVTDRTGDTVLAFGHPFLGSGPLAVPMASADILTVVSSQWTSFKVANLGPVVGAIDFDFLTGIRGTLGQVAPTVPMQIRFSHRPEQPVDLTLAKIPLLTPTLAAISILGSLDAATDTSASQSLDLELDFDLGEHGHLQIEQSFDGIGAPLAAAIHTFSMAGYLLRNRLADVDIRSLDVVLTSHREPRTLALSGAHASRTVVRPGETVQVNVDLTAYRGETFRRTVEIAVPSNLEAGRYVLLVGGGQSTDGVRLGLEQANPRTFPQALKLLNSLQSQRRLTVLGLVEQPGLSVAGEVLPALPGSVRSLWSASGSGSARPLRLSVVEEAGVELDRPIDGLLRIDLEVKRGRPVPGNGNEAPKRKSPRPRPGGSE